MTRTTGQRQDQFLAQLFVDGVDCGMWDGHEGGDIEVEASSTRISGGRKVQLGSQIDISAITLTRLHRKDTRATYDFLRTRAGKGEAEVHLTEKDDDGAPFGATFVNTGVLGGVPMLTYDENSKEKSEEKITIDCDA